MALGKGFEGVWVGLRDRDPGSGVAGGTNPSSIKVSSLGWGSFKKGRAQTRAAHVT